MFEIKHNENVNRQHQIFPTKTRRQISDNSIFVWIHQKNQMAQHILIFHSL